jgi:hypothetical protein
LNPFDPTGDCALGRSGTSSSLDKEPIMILRASLTTLGLIAASTTAFAQYGGMGGMGGGMGMVNPSAVPRGAVIETNSGQKLTGKVQLEPVMVTSDIGQYQIKPLHVKAIRFSKEPETVKGPQEANQGTRGTVITTTDKEISGTILNATWTLELEYGTLLLDASKVRSVAFTAPGKPVEEKTVRASDLGSDGLKVTRIEGPNIAALMVEGPKITRIAASSGTGEDWIPCDLAVPFEGRAMPIVAPGVVVYALGSRVYAFSAQNRHWDVLELQPGVMATPIVMPGSARIQLQNHSYEFAAATGKWKHVDLKAILESGSLPGGKHPGESQKQ